MQIPNWIFKAFKILFIAIWMYLLLLITINFIDRINELIRIFFVYSIIFLILFKHKITFNLELVLLLLFGTSYYFMYTRYQYNLEWTHIRLWLGAPALYFAGKSFISEKTEKYFKWTLLLFAFGLFTYGFLGMLNYYTYLPPYNGVVTQDIWSGEVIGATLSGVYYTAIGSLFVYFIVNVKLKKFWYMQIVYFALFGLSIYFSIKLRNRTFFVITGIVILVGLFTNLYVYKKSIIKRLFYVPLVILFIYGIYHFNLLGVQDFITSTRWYIRVMETIDEGLLADPRFKVYGIVRDQIFLYPFGGYQMDLGGLTHAHNMWLDALHTAGVYSFFLLIAYTLMTA
ncbi:MAG: hypothetical protein Q7I99_09505, partial [Acholeplasmataceae bacterium]|nr:hypothetical protein [Acholeplasmataceae bacterium]